MVFIDDNPLDLFIASKLVERLGIAARMHCFDQGSMALDYFASSPRSGKTLVFIDIQMPKMDGFGFLEAFGLLPESQRRDCHLFMLSSSINELDLERAKSYNQVRAFLQKPLNKDLLSRHLEVYGGSQGEGEGYIEDQGTGSSL